MHVRSTTRGAVCRDVPTARARRASSTLANDRPHRTACARKGPQRARSNDFVTRALSDRSLRHTVSGDVHDIEQRSERAEPGRICLDDGNTGQLRRIVLINLNPIAVTLSRANLRFLYSCTFCAHEVLKNTSQSARARVKSARHPWRRRRVVKRDEIRAESGTGNRCGATLAACVLWRVSIRNLKSKI